MVQEGFDVDSVTSPWTAAPFLLTSASLSKPVLPHVLAKLRC
jgi:hypothetical protein